MFRKQALRSRSSGFSNPINISGETSTFAVVAGGLVVILGLAILGMNFDYTTKVQVFGRVDPRDGNVTIASSSAGRLDLEVVNGAYVKQGDLLATISAADFDRSGTSRLDMELSSLRVRQRLLSEAIELIEEQLLVEAKHAEASQTQQQTRLSLAEEILTSTQRRAKLAQEGLERAEGLLSKGLTTTTDVAAIEQDAVAAIRDVAEAETAFEDQRAEFNQLALRTTAKLLDLEHSKNKLLLDIEDVKQKAVLIRAERFKGVFAPISGHVTFLEAQEGEDTDLGNPLLEITPSSSDWVATLFVTSTAIGFIEPGDPVQIRYAAYPFQDHGTFTGLIAHIDTTAQIVASTAGQGSHIEPVYKVIVDVEQTPTSKRGVGVRLTSGMTLEASIEIERKPILQWLLNPVL